MPLCDLSVNSFFLHALWSKRCLFSISLPPKDASDAESSQSAKPMMQRSDSFWRKLLRIAWRWQGWNQKDSSRMEKQSTFVQCLRVGLLQCSFIVRNAIVAALAKSRKVHFIQGPWFLFNLASVLRLSKLKSRCNQQDWLRWSLSYSWRIQKCFISSSSLKLAHVLKSRWKTCCSIIGY